MKERAAASVPVDAEALFRALASRLGEASTAAPAQRFGDGALKVDGRIYAALSHGRLLLKLPAARVEALLAAGQGERFRSGGRVMKAWVTVGPEHGEEWLALAREARAFVAGPAR